VAARRSPPYSAASTEEANRMNDQSIRLQVADGVAHIGLNRPGNSNAFDLPTARAFDEATRTVEADVTVKAILLTGVGKRFCAGGDVTSILAAPDPASYLKELADVLDGALQRLDSMSKPVVAAVQGAVAGAGLGVMLSADLIVAARGTKFLAAYAGIGLTPDCGVSWLLPRAVGQPRALDIVVNGRVLDAEEALSWGLVTEVVDTGAQEHAKAIASRLAAGPSFAFGQARRLVRGAWDVDRVGAGADEAVTISQAVTTPEATAMIVKFATT